MSYNDDIAPYPHKLKVKRHLGSDFSHCYSFSDFECETYCGKTVRIDLFVAGTLPKDIDPVSLIGKTVEVDYSHGYLFIGEGVRIVE